MSEAAPPPAVPTAPARPGPRVQATRLATLALTLALIALGVAWESWLAPLPGGSGRLVWKVLPLLLALPGLWRMHLNTYRWLSLMIWLYAAEGALRAWSGPQAARILAGFELVLALAVFAACAAHVRARLAAGRALAEAPAPSAPTPAV